MDINFIEIEPTNYCNNDCVFCRPAMKRSQAFLGMSKYVDVINELADMDYQGWISFAGLGEPLMHPRIFDFLTYRKTKLPDAQVVLYTNGIEFDDPQLFELLADKVDFVLYNNYQDHIGAMLWQAYTIAETKPELLCIDHSGGTYGFYNDRGGQPELSKYKRPVLTSPCANFKHRLFLSAEGYWVTCCQDVKQIRKWDMTIKELLNNEEYIQLRDILSRSRAGVPLCKNCGVEMGTIYFPPPLPDRLKE